MRQLKRGPMRKSPQSLTLSGDEYLALWSNWALWNFSAVPEFFSASLSAQDRNVMKTSSLKDDLSALWFGHFSSGIWMQDLGACRWTDNGTSFDNWIWTWYSCHCRNSWIDLNIYVTRNINLTDRGRLICIVCLTCTFLALDQ